MTSLSSTKSLWIGKWGDVEADLYSYVVEWTDDGMTVSGDCVIASASDGFKWKRTNCDADAAYFCQPRRPNCPLGYIWIPGAGPTSCFRFLPAVGYRDTANNKMEQSISTANKVCLDDKTSLAAPDTEQQLTNLAEWLKYSDRIIHGHHEDQGDTPKLFLGYR